MAALHIFQSKYGALPGDLTTATTFWGVQNATPATCATTASSTALTCNGNGNGIIEASPTSALFPASSAGSNEVFRFWQHLSNAGLIEGRFDGIAHGIDTLSPSSLNSPASINGSLWQIFNLGTQTVNTATFMGYYGNTLMLGVAGPYYVSGPMLSGSDVYDIDKKLDDGKPALGKVRVHGNGTFTECTDASTYSTLTASYLLTNSKLACSILFPTGL